MMRVWRLSDVCLSVAYIGPNSRTERPRKTKIGTEGSSRHTWLGHHFQGQKVKGQLVADVLNSQHAEIGATWRINTKILSTCKWRGHMCRHAHSLLEMRCFIECLTMSFDLVWFCFVQCSRCFPVFIVRTFVCACAWHCCVGCFLSLLPVWWWSEVLRPDSKAASPTGTRTHRCASVCVVECRICNREVAGSNLSLGYFAPRSTQPSIPPG